MDEGKVKGKVVSRSIAITLGIAIIILSIGLLVAITHFTSMLKEKDNIIATKNSQIDSLNMQIVGLQGQIADMQDRVAFLSAEMYELARENYRLKVENERLGNENAELRKPSIYTAYWWWYNYPSTPQSHATVHVVLFNSGMESTNVTLTVYLYDEYGNILKREEFPAGYIDGRSGKYVNFTVDYYGDAKACTIVLTWS
ncbi:MAG: hypothetical protein QXU47_07455 [Candidatus Bathyarchaeia archaeon]